MTWRSGSQRTAAFTAAGGHDGPTGPGAHAQPEAVDPGPPPIVRLEGPLTLGHGCVSSSYPAFPARKMMRPAHPRAVKQPLVSSFFRTGAVPESGRCRITDVWRPSEGTEVASAGQTTTAPGRGRRLHHRAFTGWHPRRNLLASGKQAVRSTSSPNYLPPDNYRLYAATTRSPGPVHTCG